MSRSRDGPLAGQPPASALGKNRDAGDVATGMCVAVRQSCPDRVNGREGDDRDCLSCLVVLKCRGRVSKGVIYSEEKRCCAIDLDTRA
jgi:hypothetical protein